MPKRSEPKVYAEQRKPYSTIALIAMGFVRDGSRMVKRGACRSLKAEARSPTGEIWRITPLVRHWK
ncbi:hypothetical protein LJR296_007949 [Cupriavidus necator]|uniref:hypothetical protein n=1 Tax=Cupriavidus necator TaxID=106590 RepID=UPI003ED1500E